MIDGTEWRGIWLGSPDAAKVGLKTDKEEKTFYWDEVAGVVFRAEAVVPRASFGEVPVETPEKHEDQPSDSSSDSEDQEATKTTDVASGGGPSVDEVEHSRTSPAGEVVPVDSIRAIFYLADGGILHGELLLAGSDEDSIRARTVLGERVAIPFDRLAGVQLADSDQLLRADKLFHGVLESRLPGKDVLITRDVDQPKNLRGQVLALGADRGEFHFANRSRWIRSQRVYGVVFAQGVTRSLELDFPLTVSLVDGSRFSGRLLRDDGRSLYLRASVGVDVEIPHAQLTSLKFHSDRIVYVSDLTPSGRELEGILHHPWPVQFDRSVGGGPLLIDSKEYAKGIGMHSRTLLMYRLDRKYESLAGTIGLDDAVRPRGHVEFRVLGDGNILFASGPVTGKDHGRKMIVDVAGVRELELVVDFAEAVDLSDHANWGDLRLITPRRTPRSESY